jgi:hypothetical protein
MITSPSAFSSNPTTPAAAGGSGTDLLYSAGIGAGANLISSLLSMRAQAAQQKRQALLDSIQQNARSGIGSQKAMNEGQNNAFRMLLSGFQGANS